MSRDTLVIVPVKDPAQAKTRLSPVLAPPRRAEIARVLLGRSLSLLSELRAELGFGLAVVTPSAEIASKARKAGALALPDPGRGLNAALDAAARHAADEGYAQICVLPADLAAPRAEDIRRIIAFPRSPRSVLICPAKDGGTNALRLAPGAIAFHYGPRSAERHALAAQSAGLTPVILPLASLAEDVDTVRDLTRAAHLAPELRGFA
ncbi:2-phospho-L-lactate guanylyltransferase [Poseidonocella sedimentorum]|uniref:3-phospho-D-glycerate guanylyltransferase n=1 Tax=Poseidonocella sedimentorum TaxID=871652 RepID=A0A1I6E3T7_9RHOB|nr:2-phospho-L-lactate guanylyltransferase [Poseidonocella sedimentorum]SFR12405.1 2-phospho-L-lactate guanylyltransferase [Poseidonocella sedimentorum]